VGVGDALSLAANYFNYTLTLADKLGRATSQVIQWGAQGYSPLVSEIQDLYPKQVTIYCALQGDDEGVMMNRLLAVQTCWAKAKESIISPLDIFLKDCPPIMCPVMTTGL